MTEDTKPPQWIVDKAEKITAAYGYPDEEQFLQAAIIEAMQEAGREVAFYFAGQSSATVPSDERAAFEAHFATLDHSTTQDAWGRPVHVYPVVAALWDGWQARAVLALAAPAVQAEPVNLPDLPKAFKVVSPSASEPYGLFTARQMIEYRLATPAAQSAEQPDPTNEEKVLFWMREAQEAWMREREAQVFRKGFTTFSVRDDLASEAQRALDAISQSAAAVEPKPEQVKGMDSTMGGL